MSDITEADRELFIRLMGLDAADDFDRIRRGEFDHWEKMKAIAAHRQSAADEIERLRAEVERYRQVFESTAWTIGNQSVAKALCSAVANCALGPSDDEDMLALYDIIPDEWCAPDRAKATNDIAENMAFAALDAWLTAARAALRGQG